VKLVPKLGLALFAGVAAVVAVFATWRVHEEINLFDEDARKDQRVVGLTASAALSMAETRRDALAMARSVDQSRPNMTIRYVSLEPHPQENERPLMPLDPATLRTPQKWVQLVKPRDPRKDQSDTLVTYVAAPVADEPSGAMELSQPLASRTQYAWRGFVRVLTSISAMLMVGGVAMTLIGARVVGQPVAELIAATRRISDGDFDVLGASERADEFGELTRALRAMSRDLSAARERAAAETDAKIRAIEQLRHAERLATLGQLASVLAHEVGNPLNVIAGHGKLVATGRLDQSDVRESGAQIGIQCERITNIVKRVLDYARRAPPRRRAIRAADLVGQTWELLRGLALQKEVELVIEDMHEPADVFVDLDQIHQALTNIVVNAIHASSRGAVVSLGVEAAVLETAGQVGPGVVFVIRDHGHGIDPTLTERIFEPFFTTKSLGEGTGLGLSVARDIIEEHGGKIVVESVVGAGTTFRVYLPRSTDHVGTRTDS